jgi:hypothetical protein
MIGAVIDTLFKAVVGAMKAHGSVGGLVNFNVCATPHQHKPIEQGYSAPHDAM